MKFGWGALKEFLILLIGIVLVIFLNDLQNNVERAESRAITSIAGDCRVLLVLNQPLQEEGPCFDPEVREVWEDLPLEPLERIHAAQR